MHTVRSIALWSGHSVAPDPAVVGRRRAADLQLGPLHDTRPAVRLDASRGASSFGGN